MSMPNRLFHYQKFVQEYLIFISLLSERKVKFSRPDSFNDPWDCRVHYRLPSDSDGRKRVVNWLSDMHRKHFPSMSEAERIRKAQDFLANPLQLQKAFV
jgi:hypothetical protein